jgi:hypothetical protein
MGSVKLQGSTRPLPPRRKGAATCVGWRQFVQHHDGARGRPSMLVAQMRSTGESGKTARHPSSGCGHRANAASVETSTRCLWKSKAFSPPCRGTPLAHMSSSQATSFRGLAQIVSHTSTRLVAKARALEARDQDLDRNLDTLPGRHPGRRDGIDAFVPRAIDERADRGTGYPRRAYRR